MNKLALRFKPDLFEMTKDSENLERPVYQMNEKFRKLLCEAINEAATALLTQENELFVNKVSEATLKYRFSKYFEIMLENKNLLLDSSSENSTCGVYYIDFEYNRTGKGIKIYDGKVFRLPSAPDKKAEDFLDIENNNKLRSKLFDMVVHQRGLDNKYPENLIHFEFKTRYDDSNKTNKTEEINNDFERLRDTTSLSNNKGAVEFGVEVVNEGKSSLVRGYQLGCMIVFENACIKVKSVSNGEVATSHDLKPIKVVDEIMEIINLTRNTGHIVD